MGAPTNTGRDAIAFPDFRLFDSAQDILDHNKRIIKEIKSNHEIQTPEALARNCCLIKELNTNVAAVMQAYQSIGDGFAQYMSQNPPPPHDTAQQGVQMFAAAQQQQQQQQQAGDIDNNTSAIGAAAAMPQAPPT
ncbi:hypothetical protein D9Q98_001623 [Chlorella vulgaris]|uniref:Protein EARLY FLOWERING 4 domain-containing protein n=1 Tax=Chlorella vulgaris TaxID=3077 RepID=A0A9D4TUV3_CHLVU|nr:hypothetical protein D9Q98_001623 [Chlorella vulgaris]